jgi:hypothetical protein
MLLIRKIIVSEVYAWPEYDCPSHYYSNMTEIIPSNETMTAAQLVNQWEEVGI